MFIICCSVAKHGSKMSVRCMSERLGLQDIVELFESVDGAVEQLNKPKGGEVYVFEGKHPEDWRADGYR